MFFNEEFSYPERALYEKLESMDAKVLHENCQRVTIGQSTLGNVCLLGRSFSFFKEITLKILSPRKETTS